MLSKEKFDLDIHAEGLAVRGKTTEKGNGNKSKNRSKSKNPHVGKTCNYYGNAEDGATRKVARSCRGQCPGGVSSWRLGFFQGGKTYFSGPI